MKIHLDTERCTGHGRCYALAPELFDCDEMGHSVLRHAEVPDGLEDEARLAVQTCPEGCLTLG